MKQKQPINSHLLHVHQEFLPREYQHQELTFDGADQETALICKVINHLEEEEEEKINIHAEISQQ